LRTSGSRAALES